MRREYCTPEDTWRNMGVSLKAEGWEEPRATACLVISVGRGKQGKVNRFRMD